MSQQSNIEWTDATWNPTRGCRKVSLGCKHCYAETFADRFAGVKGHPYELGFAPRLAPDKLDAPLHWKKPRRIFVNSMSDLFLEDFSDEYIAAVFGVMAACPRHTFQVLTKRAERMARWFEWAGSNIERLSVTASPAAILPPRYEFCLTIKGAGWPLPNVWIGVSVEDQLRADERIPHLLRCPAAVRFLSVEPLLEAVDLRLCPMKKWAGPRPIKVCGIDWVIIGGESGPGARPMDIAWARSIVAQCKAAGVACFVKQLGTLWQKTLRARGTAWERLDLRDRKGGDPDEWPSDLRVREWPEARP